MSKETILMYGTTWCGDCTRAKRLFDDRSVSYEWINIEERPGTADKMMELNGGLQKVPTILFPDGAVLVEPSNEELLDQLGEKSA